MNAMTLNVNEREIRELTLDEIDEVSGAISIGWNSRSTNWGEVGSWALAGGVTGARGGLWGIGLGVLGGGIGDYLSQHFYVYAG